jgi:hypothetical protein
MRSQALPDKKQEFRILYGCIHIACLEDVAEIHVNLTHNIDTIGTVAVEESDSLKHK